MGASTLQTIQEPILLLPWLCFRGGFPPLAAMPSMRVDLSHNKHIGKIMDVAQTLLEMGIARPRDVGSATRGSATVSLSSRTALFTSH
jgi:hypothetical protein